MASMMPDQPKAQLQSITPIQLEPNYTDRWQVHVYEQITTGSWTRNLFIMH